MLRTHEKKTWQGTFEGRKPMKTKENMKGLSDGVLEKMKTI